MSDVGGRPPGVRFRVPALIDEHRDRVLSDACRRPRARMESVVRQCGRLAFGDVSAFRVLEAFRLARACPRPDVSGFGARLLDCLDDVDVALGGRADGSEEWLMQVFTSVPPPVVLGATGPDTHFHLVCVTAARSALDGIDTPYLAARAAANMAVFRPAVDHGIVAAGERLAIRYEDEPEARRRIDAEIRDELTGYLAAVPFDV